MPRCDNRPAGVERDATIWIAPRPVEDRLRAERDRYIRAFNRLEKAVAVHVKDRCLDSDDLEHVHRVVLRDLGPEGSA